MTGGETRKLNPQQPIIPKGYELPNPKRTGLRARRQRDNGNPLVSNRIFTKYQSWWPLENFLRGRDWKQSGSREADSGSNEIKEKMRKSTGNSLAGTTS